MKKLIKTISATALAALLVFTFGTNVFTTFAATGTGSDTIIATKPCAPVATTPDAPIAQKIESAAVTNIATTPAGGTVSASIPAGEYVKPDVWKAAMEKGTSMEITSYAGVGIKWSFGTVTNSVWFDPTVYVGKTVKEVSTAAAVAGLPEASYTTVSFPYHGDLPGTAEVSIDLTNAGKFTRGQVVYLYYYNPETGKFEYIDDGVYQGYTTFTMTHCSEYIVTSSKLTTGGATSPKTGEE